MDPPPVENGVNTDIENFPFEKLSDYNFYVGELKNLSPNEGVLPYDLISHLFTDYALKKRFIWIPEGQKANYVSDGEIFDFPDGTITLKNFYYENVLPDLSTRIIETRMIYKKDGAWQFAEYVWNEDQSEAFFNLDGSFTNVSWLENEVEKSTNYRIPSESQCLTCHKQLDVPILIGPKPQNLNMDMDYGTETINQLEKWTQLGYVDAEDLPVEIETVVDWENESEEISKRMRSYVDINCAHCHSEESHCSYRSMRFAYSESADDDNMGICIEPDENLDPSLTHIISSGNIDRSMVYYRLNTNDEIERMPLLGRSIIHEEALEMIEEYINSLDSPC